MIKLRNWTIIISALAIVACNTSTKNNGYVINGKINKEYSGKLFLFSGSTKIDSTTVADSRFLFEGVVNQPESFSIYTDGISTIDRNFFIENDVVEITLNYSVEKFEEHKLNRLTIKSLKGTKTAKVENEFYTYINSKNQKNNDQMFQKVNSIIQDFPKHPIGGNILHEVSNDTILNLTQLKSLHASLNLTYQLKDDLVALKKNIFPAHDLIIGKEVLDFTLINTEENFINIKDFGQEKFILIDFWASWCKPCRNQFPHIKELVERYEKREFTVLGISLENKVENWKSTIKKDSLNWENLIDTNAFSGDLAMNYNIERIPFNLLLDKKRRIIAVNITPEQLEIKLDSIFR